METWWFMSEVVSLAVRWVDSKTFQGNLDEFWLLKNAIGAIFCRQVVLHDVAFAYFPGIPFSQELENYRFAKFDGTFS